MVRQYWAFFAVYSVTFIYGAFLCTITLFKIKDSPHAPPTLHVKRSLNYGTFLWITVRPYYYGPF